MRVLCGAFQCARTATGCGTSTSTTNPASDVWVQHAEVLMVVVQQLRVAKALPEGELHLVLSQVWCTVTEWDTLDVPPWSCLQHIGSGGCTATYGDCTACTLTNVRRGKLWHGKRKQRVRCKALEGTHEALRLHLLWQRQHILRQGRATCCGWVLWCGSMSNKKVALACKMKASNLCLDWKCSHSVCGTVDSGLGAACAGISTRLAASPAWSRCTLCE